MQRKMGVGLFFSSEKRARVDKQEGESFNVLKSTPALL